MLSHLSNTQVVLVTDGMGSQATIETSSKYIASGYLHGTIIALHTGLTLQALKLRVPLCAWKGRVKECPVFSETGMCVQCPCRLKQPKMTIIILIF